MHDSKLQPNIKEQTILRKSLRNNSTAAEALLWKRLNNRQVDGLKFRRQYGMGPYILDFFCCELRLCIELDGEAHNKSEAVEYDERRTWLLEKNDITVMRYKNEVVYQSIETIVDDIKRFREHKRGTQK